VWSTVLSIFGIVVGALVQSHWFPCQTCPSAGYRPLPHILKAACHAGGDWPAPVQGPDRRV
jgi:hypothetical protein